MATGHTIITTTIIKSRLLHIFITTYAYPHFVYIYCTDTTKELIKHIDICLLLLCNTVVFFYIITRKLTNFLLKIHKFSIGINNNDDNKIRRRDVEK
jgi:hypothetical protein